MHTIIRWYLRFLARGILFWKKPVIIGVTGTVGKTTITTAIAQYLRDEVGKDAVQFSPYHYNGEYGFPLTIIGARTGWKNPFRWIWIGFVALFRMCRPYPRYLMGEYGIDHVWEMDFLRSVAVPDIVIVTPIVPNHMEQFQTLEAYRDEKLKLLRDVRHVLVHESLRTYVQRSDVRTYGSHADASLWVGDTQVTLSGTSAVMHGDFGEYPFRLPSIGAYQAENVAPVFFVAQVLGLSDQGVQRLALWLLPEVGRSRILSGKYSSTIIDGSYNGWYASMREGILSVRECAYNHPCFFFLGDMRELGEMTVHMHTRLAHDIIAILGDMPYVRFFLVWPEMRTYVAPILAQLFPVEASASSRVLGERMLQQIEEIGQWVVVYAKGSQNTIFLEEGLKFLLDETEYVHLCRQWREWQEKKQVFFSRVDRSVQKDF